MRTETYRVRQEACSSVVGGHARVSHETDNTNTSPRMSYGVLGCDIAMLQDSMLMISH